MRPIWLHLQSQRENSTFIHLQMCRCPRGPIIFPSYIVLFSNKDHPWFVFVFFLLWLISQKDESVKLKIKWKDGSGASLGRPLSSLFHAASFGWCFWKCHYQTSLRFSSATFCTCKCRRQALGFNKVMCVGGVIPHVGDLGGLNSRKGNRIIKYTQQEAEQPHGVWKMSDCSG